MFTYQISLLVVFSVLIALIVAKFPNDCEDPLSCYLASIEIDIPDSCQDVMGQELCISNFACHGIYISSLPSSYKAPTTLYLGATGLGTSCDGDYSYGRLIGGSATAIINGTDIDIGLLIGKEGELPDWVTFSHCDIPSMDVKISFTSKILDGLAPELENLIKEALDKFLCTDIPVFLETNVTNALVNTVDPALEAIISSQPSPLPVYGTHYTAWGDSLVSKVKKIMDKLEGVADLKDFLLCFLGQSDPAALQQLVTREFQSLFLSQPHFAASTGQQGDYEDEDVDMGAYRLGIPADLVIFQKGNFPPGYNTTVTLTSLQVRGLDTLDDLEILDPMESSNVTLHTSVGFKTLTVELGVQVEIVPTGSASKREQYSERLKVTLAMQDVSFLMDLVLAVNSFVLKSYYLDQLSTRNCWLSAIEQLSIANLQLHTTITTLQTVQVVGSAGPLEADVVALLNNAVLLLISPEGFGQLTTDLINGLMQGPVRTGFNERAVSQLAAAKNDMPCLSHYPYNDHPDYIVWANSSLVKTLDFVVNDLLGYQGVNKLMSCATNGTGQLSLNTSILQVQLAGLNSFYALKVLAPVPFAKNDPVRPYELDNLISLGYCPFLSSAKCNPFELIVSYKPESNALAAFPTPSKLTTAFVQAMSGFNLAVKLSNFSVYLNTELKLDKDGLRDTQYNQLSVPGCVGSSFSAVAIDNVSLSVVDAHLSVDDGQMQRNITTLIDKLLGLITREEKIQQRNSDIAYQLSVAEETCAAGGVAPHVDTTDDDSSGSNSVMNWQWELFILVVGCLSSLVLLLAAYNYWGRAGKKNACAPDFVFAQCDEETADMPIWTRLYYRWNAKEALVFHSQVPLWLRIVIPLCILGDVALFLSSNIDPRAVSVMVQLVIGTKTIDVGSVFDFGLTSTVVDMWNAGVYPLSVLIMFFSGIWPYIKLVSMLLAWLVPPKLVTIGSRETILVVLDALGKWSLIDFFVMVLMLCAFFFNIYIADSKITVNVTVLPRWGFYGFLLATMISLGLGHIILACHRLIVEPKVLPVPEEYSPKESLSSITYEVELTDKEVAAIADAVAEQAQSSPEADSALEAPLADEAADPSEGTVRSISTPVPTAAPDMAAHAKHGTTMLVTITTAGKIAVVFLLVVTALFVVAGTILDSMKFEFKGLVGLMLRDAAEVEYSFVTVGTSIPKHSGVPNDFATRWLQASFFLFGQAMPFALLLTMLVLWVVPLTLSMQRTIFVLAEVLNAWSALDVFCISIAAALLEIQQFAAFIVGDSCDAINVFLAEFMDPLLEGDDKCFDVVAQLDKNSWTVFMAAALLIVVVLPLLSVCNSAIHLRLKLSEQASLLMHHINHDTANAAVRDALRSLSKEQQYGADLDRELCQPFLDDDAAAAVCEASEDPALFKSLAASAPCGTVSATPETSTNPRNSSTSGSSPEQAQSSQNSEGTEEEATSALGRVWARMTMRNFKLSTLHLLARARLVQLAYTPTRVVDDRTLLDASNSLALLQE